MSGEVRAWYADIGPLEGDPARRSRALEWLTPDERARFDRYRYDTDRLMFALGRVMARRLVGRALDVAPTAWRWREGPHGRPEIASPDTPVHFNLAHSAGLVACVIGSGREVGVDVEDRERPPTDPAIVARFCSPAEVADIDARPAGLARSVPQLLDAQRGVSEGARPGHLGAPVRYQLLDRTGTGRRARELPPHARRHGHPVGVPRGAAQRAAHHRRRGFDGRRPVARDRHRADAGRLAAVSARLLATSDLHLGHRSNREALAALGAYPDDWLIIAGDVGEKPEHLTLALDALVPRFARVIWTPGNHDLWRPAGAEHRTRGQARYDELGRDLPRPRRRSRPKIRTRRGRPNPTRSSCRCSCSSTTASGRRRSRSSRPWPGRARAGVVSGDELMLDPFAMAVAHRLVPRPRRVNSRAAGRTPSRLPHRARQPLAASTRSGDSAARASLLDLVRHHADRGLGPPLPRARRCVRTPAPALEPRARRRPLRGSLARISAGLGGSAASRLLQATACLPGTSVRRTPAIRSRTPYTGTLYRT